MKGTLAFNHFLPRPSTICVIVDRVHWYWVLRLWVYGLNITSGMLQQILRSPRKRKEYSQDRINFLFLDLEPDSNSGPGKGDQNKISKRPLYLYAISPPLDIRKNLYPLWAKKEGDSSRNQEKSHIHSSSDVPGFAKKQMCKLFNCLFHKSYISHVLTVCIVNLNQLG